MLRRRGLDVIGHFPAHVIEQMEQLLVHGGTRHVVLEPPADRDQKEDAPEANPLSAEHLADLADVVLVEARDSGVDLHLEADLPGPPDAAHCPGEASGHAAKAVMGLSVVAVQADGETGKPLILHPSDHGLADELGARGRHRHPKADLRSVTDDIVNVRPVEGIASGEDEQDAGNLLTSFRRAMPCSVDSSHGSRQGRASARQ